MNRWLTGTALLCGTGFLAVSSHSQSICDAALIRATYQSSDSMHSDYRLATFVSQSDYETAKQSASGNAEIYGVPMGANWEQFRENVHTYTQTLKTSLSKDQIRNILWTGLDPSAAQAYTACINSTLNAGGLHLAVKTATDTDVTVLASWNPIGSQAALTATPTWTWDGPQKGRLPKALTAGQTTIVIPRPRETVQLAGSFDGHSDSIVITALPAQPSRCELFALHPRKLSCFQNSGNRPGSLPNPKKMTVTLRNTCSEDWEWKIWSGQEPSHTQWVSFTGLLEPGQKHIEVDENSDAQLRIYSKPRACQNVYFPSPNTPDFAPSWD